MVNIDTENDGLGVPVGHLKVFRDPFGDHLRAFFNYEVPVVILRVVNPVLDSIAVNVGLTLFGTPTFEIDIHADAQNLVRGEESVLDPLLEGIEIDGFPEVVYVGNIHGLFGRGGQADLGGRIEVFKYFPPRAVRRRASPVALVYDDKVEEVAAELLVSVGVLVVVGQPLVESQIDLVSLVYLLLADYGHLVFEVTEIVSFCLADQRVPIGKKEDALFDPCFP